MIGTVEALSVIRGAPVRAALIAARADERVPDERTGPGVEQDVDPTLLRDADDVTPFPIDPESEDVRAGASEIPFLVVVLYGHQVTAGGWLPHARAQGACPRTRYDHRGSPVFRSKATIDFKNEPGCSRRKTAPREDVDPRGARREGTRTEVVRLGTVIMTS